MIDDYEVTVEARIRLKANDFQQAATDAKSIVNGDKGCPDNVSIKDVLVTQVRVVLP